MCEASFYGGGWNWLRGYVYGGGGQLLAIQQSGAPWYVHADPITKSQRVTDQSGSVAAGVEVDGYGGELSGWSWNTYLQPRKFTTYERDGNGADEAMARRYNRWYGRFDQPDPWDGSYDLTDPQSFNRYAYTQNDPVNFVDPSGLMLIAIWGRSCTSVDEGRTWQCEWYISGYIDIPDHPSGAIGPWRGGGGGGGIGGGIGAGGTPQNTEPQQPQRNDCTNMADRAQQIANDVINGANAWRGTGAAAMLQRFNRLFATEFAGAYAAEGVLGMIDMPLWGSSPQTRADFGQRGFPQQFRDSRWTDDAADQTHHFAAYFSGGLAGHRAFTKAYEQWDRYWDRNPGDVALGRQAYALGRYMRRNPGQLRNVGQLIRDTICNGNPVPR